MRSRGALACLIGLAVAASSCDKPTAPARGDLSILVQGLAAGATWRVVLTPPGATPIEITSDGTLADLPAGEYLVHSDRVSATPDSIAPPADTTVRITNKRTTQLVLRHTYLTGGMRLDPVDAPLGDTITMVLLAPNDSVRTIALPATVRGLMPGTWTLMTQTHRRANGDVYALSVPATVNVTAGPETSNLSIAYSLATGALAFQFTGLPVGQPAIGYYYGSDNIEHLVMGDTVIRGLVGSYWTGVRDVYGRAFAYAGQKQEFRYIGAGATSTVQGTYVLNSGAFRLAYSGADSGAVPVIQLRPVAGGDGALRRTVTGDTIPWVTPGVYEVTSLLWGANGTNYQTKRADTVTVLLGQVSDASIEFEPRTTPFDASIDWVILTQAIQDYAQDVPLVAGREALARVQVWTADANAIAAELRVRVIDGATILIDTLLTSGNTGIPTSTSRSLPWSLFAVRLPGTVIRPGIIVTADLNPRGLFGDADPVNDHWPRAGYDVVPVVRDVPPFQVRMVPIRFMSESDAPSISQADAAAWLEETYRLHPIGNISFDVRAPYVTAVPRPTAAVPDPWITLLSDMEALRVIEGGGTRHYAGILKVGYSQGVAGIGIIGGRSTLVWDDRTSGNGILAHELGHNFGRRHAPCGNPAGVDPAYPRVVASIGDWGWDARSNVAVDPGTADLMSYCLPAWTSAYTFKGVMDARAADVGAFTEGAERGRMLLISGTLSKGVVRLDPVFVVEGASRVPRGGPHRLVLRDAAGAQILAMAFSSEPLSEPASDVEQFTLSIPERLLGAGVPASLVVEAAGRRAELRSTGNALRAGSVQAKRRTDGAVDVRWSDSGARGVIVRDAATGRIITISRHGEAIAPDLPAGYDVIVSDGLRSVTQRVRPASR